MTPLRRLPSPLFLAAFAALALAAPAQALVVITQEIDFNRLFSATTSTNAGGGTEAALFSLYGGPASNLASVQISWTPDFAGSVTALVTNNSGPTLTASLSSSYTLTSADSLFDFAGLFQTSTATLANAPRNTPLTLDPIFTTPATVVLNPTDISAFVGSGTSSVSFNLASVTRTTTNSSGGNPFNGHSGSAGGTLQIQYFLFEPIPEPGTWAMLIAGFGLIGAAQRRRRRIARRSITA
ncbi:MAG: PEPxxWA-CTERM sorting domain-containing protein [Polymorphobacter sp.]|uniref:PEPxxWA-CTERM sorting domain-containing protein n=1 Tax=Polymorphobacter sp. TaxID=1909290 RepID=UPI003A8B5518